LIKPLTVQSGGGFAGGVVVVYCNQWKGELKLIVRFGAMFVSPCGFEQSTVAKLLTEGGVGSGNWPTAPFNIIWWGQPGMVNA